jgi:hypothetical protein
VPPIRRMVSRRPSLLAGCEARGKAGKGMSWPSRAPLPIYGHGRAPPARSRTDTRCERLTGTSGPPSRLCVCDDHSSNGRPGYDCTVAPSSDWPAATPWSQRSSEAARSWWHRRRAATAEERRTLSCLFDRSSRPDRSARRTGAHPRGPAPLRARAAAARNPARLPTAMVWRHCAAAAASALSARRGSRPLRVALPQRLAPR